MRHIILVQDTDSGSFAIVGDSRQPDIEIEGDPRYW